MRSSDVELVPRWLVDADHSWVGVLAEVYERHVGCPRRDLDDDLRVLDLRAPPRAQALARRVLDRLHAPARPARGVGPEMRTRAFAAAAGTGSRERSLALAAAAIGVPAVELAETLFADLPSERRLAPAHEQLAAFEVCHRANELLVHRLLARARRVRVRTRGDPRPLVRQSRALGLMGVLTGPDADGWCTHTLAGPELTRPGRAACAHALARLLPEVTGRPQLELVAELQLGSSGRLLRLDEASPLPSRAGPADDRPRGLACSLSRDSPGGVIDRDPEAVRACGELFVPDFAVTTSRASEPLLVEVVPRWTREWLLDRVTRLRAAARDDVQLWVQWNGHDELPAGASVVPFRHRRELRDRLREAVAASRAVPHPVLD